MISWHFFFPGRKITPASGKI